MAGSIEVARLVSRLVLDSDQFNNAMGQSIKTATSWGEKMKSALSTAVVTKGLGFLAQAAKSAAGGLVNTVKAGAGLPGIAAAFNRNAAQFGVNLSAMQRASGGTISEFEMMTQANVALTGAGQMLGKEFGKNLPTLLAGARAAAAATGGSAEFMFQSLVTGVKRSSPMLIDNTGIVLKMGEANEAMAAKVGKAVKDLTSEEKSVAILNATVEATNKLIAQTGGAGMTTSEKVAGLGAVIQNFKDQVAVGLSPVLGQATGILLKLANLVLPPLQDILVNKIAPAISVVLGLVEGWVSKFDTAAQATAQFVNFTTDGLGNMVPVIEDVGKSSVDKLVNKWSEMASRALKWGIQVVTEFASGMVQGAAAALTQAMQFIGGILQSWLAPSSPPKIMPNLDKWAQSSMNLYLHNMTQADFGILDTMQGPISTALSRLVDSGDMSEKGSAEMFRGLSEGLAKAAATGDMTDGIFKQLEKTTGAYGKDIAELAKRQFKLAAATKAVQEAEESLERARSAQKDAQDNVSKLADEYNKLLAAGADESVLAAKRAEFAEAEKALDLADDQVDATESQAEEAQKALSPLQEQVALQQKIIDQMFKMTEPMSEVTDSLTAAIGGLTDGLADGLTGELEPPEIPIPIFSGEGGIASSLSTAFENAKESIKEKLLGMFQPVIDEWTRLKEGPLAELQSTWETFTTTVREFWDEKVVPIIEEIKKFIPPEALQNLGKFAGVMGVVAVVAGILVGAILLLTNPIVLLIAGIAAIVVWGGQAWEMFKDLLDLSKELAIALKDKLVDKFNELASSVKEKVIDIFEKLRDFWRDHIEPKIEELRRLFEEVLVPALTKVYDFVKDSVMDIFEKLRDIWKDDIQPLLKTIGDTLEGSFLTAWEKISGAIKDTKDKVLDGLVETFENLKGLIKDTTDKIVKFIDKLKEWAKTKLPDWAQRHSPSPIEQMLTNTRDLMAELSRQELPGFGRAMSELSFPQIGQAGADNRITNNTLNVTTSATTSTYLQDYSELAALGAG